MEEFESGGLGAEITVRENRRSLNCFYGRWTPRFVLLRQCRFDSTNHLVRKRCRPVMVSGGDVSLTID